MGGFGQFLKFKIEISHVCSYPSSLCNITNVERVYPESQCEHDTKYGVHLLKTLHLLHSHPGDEAALLWSVSPLQDANGDVPVSHDGT